MHLKNISQAKFIKKENRFVGIGILEGKEIKFHIGDTGRLAELLFEGNGNFSAKIGRKRVKKIGF